MLSDLILDRSLTQLVQQPTRGENVLDLLLTNSPGMVSRVDVVDGLPGSDHEVANSQLSVHLLVGTIMTISRKSPSKWVVTNGSSGGGSRMLEEDLLAFPISNTWVMF